MSRLKSPDVFEYKYEYYYQLLNYLESHEPQYFYPLINEGNINSKNYDYSHRDELNYFKDHLKTIGIILYPMPSVEVAYKALVERLRFMIKYTQRDYKIKQFNVKLTQMNERLSKLSSIEEKLDAIRETTAFGPNSQVYHEAKSRFESQQQGPKV